MNESQPCTASGISGAGMPKYQSLIEAVRGLDGVLSHLRELQTTIGMNENIVDSLSPQAPPAPTPPPTLVSMLNELPEEVNMKISTAHDLINRTIQALS